MKASIINLLRRSNKQKTAREIEEELQFHIDKLERKYTQEGMSAADAKAAARRRFGNFAAVKRQCENISRRNSLLQRVLRISYILLALIGFSIRLSSSDLPVMHIGDSLIFIAIAGRLLLYVRGLSPRRPKCS
jgi:hypothetical protein